MPNTPRWGRAGTGRTWVTAFLAVLVPASIGAASVSCANVIGLESIERVDCVGDCGIADGGTMDGTSPGHGDASGGHDATKPRDAHVGPDVRTDSHASSKHDAARDAKSGHDGGGEDASTTTTTTTGEESSSGSHASHSSHSSGSHSASSGSHSGSVSGSSQSGVSGMSSQQSTVQSSTTTTVPCGGCSGATPYCDLNTNICQACLPKGSPNEGCIAGQVCSDPGTGVYACSTGCTTSASCGAGTPTCCIPTGQTLGACVDTTSDPSNCGGCGTACSPSGMATVTCGGSACNGSCAGGFADCDGDLQSDGCEINIDGDPANCGGCSTMTSSFACSGNNATPSCSGGGCTSACDTADGWYNCDGTEASLRQNGCNVNIGSTDSANCGGCGRVCSSVNATPSCSGGGCNSTCDTADGWHNCDGTEASLQANGCNVDVLGSDVNNCGGCGVVCSAQNDTQSCSAGACSSACNPGYLTCYGSLQEVGCDTYVDGSDPCNCGGCDTTEYCGGCYECFNGTPYNECGNDRRPPGSSQVLERIVETVKNALDGR